MLVPQHQTVFTIPQHEGFRRTLDSVEQTLVGFRGALLQAVLLGDIHGDADQVGLGGCRVDDLGPCPHPQIVSVGMAHPKQLVYLLDIATRHFLGDLVKVPVVRVNQFRGFAKRDHAVAGLEPQDLIHRTRPVEPAARHVPVPQPAASARQGHVDPAMAFQIDSIGFLGPASLTEIGVENDEQYRRGGDKQCDIDRDGLPPGSVHIGNRRDRQNGADPIGQVGHRCQYRFAIQLDFLHTCAIPEEAERRRFGQQRRNQPANQMIATRSRGKCTVLGVQNQKKATGRIRHGADDTVESCLGLPAQGLADRLQVGRKRGMGRGEGQGSDMLRRSHQLVTIVTDIHVARCRDDHQKGYDQDGNQVLEERLSADQPVIGRLGKQLGMPRQPTVRGPLDARLTSMVRPFGRR